MTIWILLMSLFIHVQTAAKPGDSSSLKLESFLNSLWLESTPLIVLDDQLGVTTTAALPQPFFEHPQFSNVTAQLGTLVILHCKVNGLTDKTTVSWLRKKGTKLDLLSVGLEVYASDGRYSSAFKRPNDWQLHLASATEHDEGHYECQVSSHPPIVHTVFLHVVVPELEILDERGLPIKNKFYNSGSTIELKCIISKVPQPTQFIMWRHGTRILNYDTIRGGISVKTDILSDGAKSRLFIANANVQDSGNYTCSLAEVAATSVLVHVLNGETPAAMQHGGSPRSTRLGCMSAHLILSWLVLHVR